MEKGIKKVRMVFLIMLAFYFPLFVQKNAFAGTVELPKTGQTKCYDSGGREVTCNGTGQDGDIKAGLAWPSPRFTENADGTITDNLTGLTWLGNLNCIRDQYPDFDTDGVSGDGKVTWQHALDFVAGINNGAYSRCSAGYTDWRLPNINELESLVHAGYNEEDCGGSSCSALTEWLNSKGFSNAMNGYYWSSTTKAEYTHSAWHVAMWLGALYTSVKSEFLYVLPVRGTTATLWKTGQTTCYDSAGTERTCAGTGEDGEIRAGVEWPYPRFTVNGDCVTDNVTGLMWVKSPESTTRTWEEALNYANSLSLCGYDDWRLPNRKELRSLIDYSKSTPALPEGHPFSIGWTYPCWSSTTSARDTDLAWIVSPGAIGDVLAANKASSAYCVWPVRGGLFYELDISRSGLGRGAVTSFPPRIDCGEVCSGKFASGTTVTLTATAASGSLFSGWGGDCSSCGTNIECNVTMDSDKTCTATFNLASGPDLVGQWIVGPTQTCKGTGPSMKCKIKGRIQVTNIGNEAAPTSSVLRFYLSSDDVLDSEDVVLKQVAVGALKPGRSQSKKFSYSLPRGESAAGSYVIAQIDDGDTIEEVNEENNTVVAGPLQ